MRLPLNRCFVCLFVCFGWTIKWDTKKLEHSKMGLRVWVVKTPVSSSGLNKYEGGTMLGRWVVDQEQTGVFMFPPQRGEVLWGPETDPYLRAIGKARREKRLVVPLPSCYDWCWASACPSIKQEACLSHVQSGCRKGFIRFYDLMISSWIYSETPGNADPVVLGGVECCPQQATVMGNSQRLLGFFCMLDCLGTCEIKEKSMPSGSLQSSSRNKTECERWIVIWEWNHFFFSIKSYN